MKTAGDMGRRGKRAGKSVRSMKTGRFALKMLNILIIPDIIKLGAHRSLGAAGPARLRRACGAPAPVVAAVDGPGAGHAGRRAAGARDALGGPGRGGAQGGAPAVPPHRPALGEQQGGRGAEGDDGEALLAQSTWPSCRRV